MSDESPRLREIFAEALELDDPVRREAFLTEACAGDLRLRARVDQLLRAHASAGGFLGERHEGTVFEIAEKPGERIGRYRLVERLGEGGFGVVYLAEQEEPVRRPVALKIIKLGMDTRAVVARFEAERQALALMDHPNIAKVFDGGATASGRPYFAMELVRGTPITQFCDEHRLDMEARLALFRQVCQAVQHAHQKGVIHRDLKPSNLIVTMREGQPVPVIIDFGIAKATRQEGITTRLTRLHQLIGTPAYMSPEQLDARERDIDTRSDVYSLGVVLYELLAGKPPFDHATLQSAGHAGIERHIREVEPSPPSHRVATLDHAERTTTAERRCTDSGRLSGSLRGDLDRIVLKCLQKERARRYDTVEALAADLGRYLQHEPVLARPDSWSYRAGKFVRRHRLPVLLGAIAALALVAGLAGTIVLARRAAEQRDLAWRQLSRAEAINDLNHFLLLDAAPAGGTLSVGELLARAETMADNELADSEENRIEIQVAIGRHYWALDRDGKAREVLEKAYARAAARPELGLRPYAGATLASALARGGDQARAEELIQSALAEVGTNPANTLTRVYCLRCGSEVARARGDTAIALRRMEEASRLAETLPKASGLMKLSLAMDIAETHRQAGQLRESAAAFAQAWTQLKALGREKTAKAGTLLNNWALTLAALGRTQEAATHFRQAVAIEGGQGGNVSSLLLNNFARTLYELGQSAEADELATRALALARAQQNETVVNQTLLNLARIATERGELSRAEEALAEVEPRLQAVLPEGHYAFAVVATQRAALLQARGDLSAALTESNRAVTIAEKATQGREYLPAYLQRRAKIRLQQKDLAAAKADAERAVSLDQALTPAGESSSRLGQGWLLLAQIETAANQPAAAQSAFRSAADQLLATLGETHPSTREAIAGRDRAATR